MRERADSDIIHNVRNMMQAVCVRVVTKTEKVFVTEEKKHVRTAFTLSGIRRRAGPVTFVC